MIRARTMAALTVSAAALALVPATFAEDREATGEPIEEIVVVGIRGSLEAAAEMKRADDRIIDAIVAEDIGKLPDNNIAEALQRVTGVSISRDFGVGTGVSIRGLSQNRVELNGRSTLGDGRDGISFEDFPSSFLSAVEVIKSPTADMIEGALGGTVSLKMLRPLDLPSPVLAANADYEHADKTEEWAPIVNVSAGNNWELANGGSVGVLGWFSYQDREIRQDEFKNRVRLYDEDVNGLTANTPSGRFAVREQNTVEQYVETRERTAVNLSLQWAPASDRGNFYIDLNMTEREGGQEGSSILDVGGARTYNTGTTQDSNGQVNNYSLINAFVIPKTWSDFRETESSSHAVGGEWDFKESLTVSGEFAAGSSDSYRPDSEFNLRPVSRDNWSAWAAQYTPGTSSYDRDRSSFGLRHTLDAAMVQSGDDIPSVVYSDPQALLNPDNLAIRAFRHDRFDTENNETAVRFDLDYRDSFGLERVSSLKAGVRFTENDYEFTQRRLRLDNLYRRVLMDAGLPTERPHVVWIDDFEAMFPGTFETVDHPNSFNQHGLSGRSDLLNYRIYKGDLLTNPEETFGRIQQMLQGTNYEIAGTLNDNLAIQEGAFRDITEETGAAYLSGELDFGSVRAVVGGRYVRTDIDSTVIVDGDYVDGSHDYTDFLPSVNITFEARRDTLIRFAAAKVMRRPDYSELSPAFLVNGAIWAAEQGALDLDPYRATQYDLSVEYYSGEGHLVSAAVFYKDVESFLSSTNSCVASPLTAGQQVTEWENICLLNAAGQDNSDLVYSTLADFAGSPDPDQAGFEFTAAQRDAGLTGIATNRQTNGENGTVQGFELGYQHNLDFLPGIWSGLGVALNYTYADSEQPNGNMLLGISENTFNAQVYWESDTVQVRLAYNYRDEFLSTEEETRVTTVGGRALNSSTNDETSPSFDPTAGNNYQDGRGQLDLSAGWAVTDRITVVANVINLLEEPSTFITELGSPWYYIEADRRFSIGVRAKL